MNFEQRMQQFKTQAEESRESDRKAAVENAAPLFVSLPNVCLSDADVERELAREAA